MNVRLLLIIPIILAWFSSCFDEDKYENTSKRANFEALWTVLDEKYCFFEYKNIDWNQIYDSYSVRIDEGMSGDAFFDLMDEMLDELKDGHVNLTSPFNLGRYWEWYTAYPDNFDEKIQRNYIGTDYGISAGLKYKQLEDNIGYIHYASFSSGVGEGNLNQVLMRLSECDGIILDIRNNGGGVHANIEKIASHFMNEKTLVAYILHKTGKGHTDFSEPYALYVEPSSGIRYQKKVVVLTNRKCYSSANDFVNAMRYAPNVVLLGDKTGGGGGMPFSSELPNGWGIRFSASPSLNAEMEHLEFGVDPDIKVDMSEEDMKKGLDTIIEEAKKIIKAN